jgi:hypothetical protein
MVTAREKVRVTCAASTMVALTRVGALGVEKAFVEFGAIMNPVESLTLLTVKLYVVPANITVDVVRVTVDPLTDAAVTLIP